MKIFDLLSLIVSLGVITMCVAQDGPIELEPPQIPPIENPIRIPPIQSLTIKPTMIWPSICLLTKMPKGCNLCQYGQPLTGVTCGRGERNCSAIGGTCKINQYDRAYCCPQHHPGCCSAVTVPIIILPNPTSFCIATCTTDAQCPYHQKCCGNY